MPSELELVAELLHKTSKILVIKAASGGFRYRLERGFQKDLAHTMVRAYGEVSQTLVDTGILAQSIREANRMKVSGLSPARIKREATRILEDTITPALFDSTSHKSAFQRVQRVWSLRFYEFGAVTALRSMGFQAHSRRVDELRTKVEVTKATGGPLTFELGDGAIVDALENRTIKFGDGLNQRIIEDARRMVRDRIYLGTLDTHRTAELISRGTGVVGWRSLKIARTEAQQAFNTATFHQFHRSGVQLHSWITVGDDRVRPQHVRNEAAGAIPIGNPFPSGQIHPGDGPLAANCRCSLMADLSDPNILLSPWDGSAGPYLADTTMLSGPRLPWGTDTRDRLVDVGQKLLIPKVITTQPELLLAPENPDLLNVDLAEYLTPEELRELRKPLSAEDLGDLSRE